MKEMHINAFLDIEKKYGLNFLEINGVNFWQYARFEIWNYIFCAEGLQLQEAHRTTKKLPIISLLADLVKSYTKYFFAKQRNVDVCFITHARRIKENEYYDCMYTESLIEKYPNSIVLEKPYKYGHLTPIRTNNIYYTDWIIIIGSIYAKLHKMVKTSSYKKVYKQMGEQLEVPFKEMLEAYELETKFDRVIKLAVEKYFLCKMQYSMYERLLKKFQPKVIVEVCYYTRQCMLINEIARKMGIPTIELQHGTMHSEHAAYQYKEDRTIPQLPTEMLLFSDYWKTQINVPIASEHLIATGFPYFESKVEQYKTLKEKNERKTILFISQGTIGKELSMLAVDLSKKLNANDYRVIYKLHPGEYTNWKEEYTWLRDSDIEVVDNHEKNIYAYFAEADIQIGVYSTAMYEGLGFGLKTIIYNVGHADTMASLVEQGYAVFVNDVEEIMSELQREDQSVNGVVFWKANALDNIGELLNDRIAYR